MQKSELRVTTTLGAFAVALDEERAPATCRYFRELAARGALDGGGIFRITTAVDDVAHAIEIVQLGTRNGLDEVRTRIPHESTSQTGLAHRRWTASAARMAPGVVYGSMFICMRDEPSLDQGGLRNEDGRGFAAFGEVVAGQDVLQAIFRRARRDELLPDPIGIERVEIVGPDLERRR